MPPDELEHVLKQFRRQKTRNTAERTAITCRLDKPGDMGIWKSTLTLNAINQAWREGISEPLRTAERVISRLLRSVEQGVVSMPLVVVSGGTARNPAVKSHMTTLCFSRGLPVVFTDDFDVPLVHALVAPQTPSHQICANSRLSAQLGSSCKGRSLRRQRNTHSRAVLPPWGCYWVANAAGPRTGQAEAESEGVG